MQKGLADAHGSSSLHVFFGFSSGFLRDLFGIIRRNSEETPNKVRSRYEENTAKGVLQYLFCTEKEFTV